MPESKKDLRHKRNKVYSKGHPPRLNSHREGRYSPLVAHERQWKSNNVYRAASNYLEGTDLEDYNEDHTDTGPTLLTRIFTGYVGVRLHLSTSPLPYRVWVVAAETQRIINREPQPDLA